MCARDDVVKAERAWKERREVAMKKKDEGAMGL